MKGRLSVVRSADAEDIPRVRAMARIDKSFILMLQIMRRMFDA